MLSKKLIVAMMFSLVMAAGGAFAGGDAANGAKLSADCADCHGDDGLGDHVQAPGRFQYRDRPLYQLAVSSLGDQAAVEPARRPAVDPA